ncbi:MAG: DedA family protein [Thermoleophilia bacterium]|nr:DedA family protein [Thermoleophilia bacterium]
MWVTVPPGIGYGALAALVGAESAGLPVPGETALVAASMLAAAGHLSLSLVIAVATIAGAAGDNVGYAMGRHLGRDALVSDRGLLRHHRRAAIERADRFFARHGLWAVFLARWLPGVRVAGAMAAGASRMPLVRFAPANLLGAAAWSAATALVVYALGARAVVLVLAAGLAMGAAAATVAVVRRSDRAPDVIAAAAARGAVALALAAGWVGLVAGRCHMPGRVARWARTLPAASGCRGWGSGAR